MTAFNSASVLPAKIGFADLCQLYSGEWSIRDIGAAESRLVKCS